MRSILSAVRHRSTVSTALTLTIAIMVLSACTGCVGLERAPKMVSGTNIEIKEVKGGVDYVIEIGQTETTVFTAILTGNGQRHLGYVYQDDYALNVRRMEVHTFSTVEYLDPTNPVQEDLPDGDVRESDQMSAPNNLFERILESPSPMLALVGDGGNVMFVMGDQGKSRLAEIVAYDAENFD